MMTTDAGWFDVCEGEELMQGDLLRRVPRFTPTGIDEWPPLPDRSPDVEVDLVDAIILTQSCDLAQEKVQRALLARVVEWSKLVESRRKQGDPSFGGRKSRENLHRGHQPGLVLLQKVSPVQSDPSRPHLPWSIVDLHDLFLAPVSILRMVAASQGTRLRLKPGYRGFLAQAFGAYFMRPDHLESTEAFTSEGKLD